MKKIVISVVAFAVLSFGLCLHVDPETGAWGLAIPGTGPDAAQLDAELHDLLGSEGGSDVVPRAKELVRRGASLESSNRGGMQAVHLAARSGYVAAVAWMLDEGVAIDSRSADGLQPIHEAASGGHLAVVRLLLELGASATASTHEGLQALHYAAMSGDKEVVECLIDAGAALDNKDENGWTPYKYADDDGVRALLLAAGAKRPPPTLYEKNELGKKLSRLWLTADGPEDMRNQAIELLAAGARADITFEGVQPIHFWLEDATIVRMLLENGASASVLDENGQPPLLLAVSAGHTDTVKALLEGGADPKQQDRHGTTPMEIAEGPMRELLSKR